MINLIKVFMIVGILLWSVGCGDASHTVPISDGETLVALHTTQESNTIQESNSTQEVQLTQESNRTQEVSTTQETNTTPLVKKPISMVDIPANQKIFIIGDSTAFNRADGIDLGWGSHVKDYMIHPENAINLASGGQSSRSYKKSNEWRDWNKTKIEILKAREDAPVYLLVQFGSNDRSDTQADAQDTNNKTTMPGRDETFYKELKVYIDWAREHDVTPVLVTPLHIMYKEKGGELRNEFKRPFGNYIESVRDLAADENVLLLDLAKKSYAVFNAYDTKEDIIKNFGVFAKKGAHQDYTHFSEKGATEIGSWVKELACQWDDKSLCAQFKPTL